MQTTQLVLSHPLLWWLLSIIIVGWAVLVVHVEQKPIWFDRLIILSLIILSAFSGGDWYAALSGMVIQNLEQLFSVKLIFQGSKGVIGAMLGVTIVFIMYFHLRKLPALAYADKAVPYAALAYAVARIGCFTNGDDFGMVTSLPWGVEFASSTLAYNSHLDRGWIEFGALHSLTVHPTQLYHAAFGFIGFILLLQWKPTWDGSRFALAWVYYGATRFIVQYYRDDHWEQGALIDRAQWFCLAFIVFGFCLWLYHKFQQSREDVVVVG